MENRKYNIAYATGSRADYGIVRNYLHYLNNDSEINFSVLVTGTHLEMGYGNSLEVIENDGFQIDLKVNIEISASSTSAILNSMAIAIRDFGYYFENNKYDLLIILGDRYEMMAVAIAAAMQKTPILHLHGGETTYGNYDEFIRHCITKMSRFHFASTDVYRNRIIQMGENPDFVFNMGALGAENCLNINEQIVSKNIQEFEHKQYLVVAFHPETLTDNNLIGQINEVISALETFLYSYDIVLIGTNADTKADLIRQMWIDFANKDKVSYFENLNPDSYLYLIKNSVCLIGNSSSGIIEAPSLGTYSINIGDRQKGRIHGDSVIDCLCEKKSILSAFNRVIQMINKGHEFFNPYYQKDTSKRCYQKTKELVSLSTNLPKEFYDLKEYMEEKL